MSISTANICRLFKRNHAPSIFRTAIGGHGVVGLLAPKVTNPVIAMTASDWASPLEPEFNEFLFASIGEERHEMRLSVLSALARLDVDPWQEAAALAKLPRKTATERLAALLARLPPSARPDAGATAARLIALLPQRAGLEALSRKAFFDLGAMTDPQTVIYVIFTAFVLAAIFNASYPSPARMDDVLAPISSTVSPPPAPPDFERN
jgi:hypothetical protein